MAITQKMDPFLLMLFGKKDFMEGYIRCIEMSPDEDIPKFEDEIKRTNREIQQIKEIISQYERHYHEHFKKCAWTQHETDCCCSRYQFVNR